jgi:para-aminobenzoate synthetase / 4-amino-4-deoxychorismate lyase
MTTAGDGGAPAVRLDALGGAGEGRSFRFAGLVRVLRADRLGEVLPVLAGVEEAAAAGLHAAGFVAYEAAPAFDPALATHPPDPRLPLAWFALFARREEVPPSFGSGDARVGEWEIDLDRAAYGERVGRVRALIGAGDSYQVNLTARLRAPFSGDPLALYARLCRAQRSAFCAFLELGDGTSIVSASPELFFRASEGALELRPMKGTRPRGRWPEEDHALAAELAASPKDRAENLMIVDLLRSDAGRVAEFGSVRVERPFQVERYETVHQMTSTVTARLRPDAGLVEVFRALFPCGSVTGAPKVRTMEIIRDLETGPRGAYCGAIGFVSPGEAAFSVGIRTLVVRDGAVELGVGSGVTWDSDAGDEYRECWDKAAFVRRVPADFRLLETILWEPGEGWFLLDGHLERMAASAEYFGFAFAIGQIESALAAEARGFGPGPQRVRLTVGRDGASSIESAPLARTLEPVRLRVAAADPVDSRDPLLYHKTTHREGYERRRAAHPGADDVLLVNKRGELTEATIANLVVRLDGALCTPPLDAGLLPGVFRAHLLRGGEVRERVLRPEDLAGAEEVWLVSSLRRWRRGVVDGEVLEPGPYRCV